MILIVGSAFKDKLFKKEKSGLITCKFYTIEPVFFIEGSSFEPKLLDNPWVIRFVKKKNISKLDQIILQIALSKGKIKNGILKALINNEITKRQARSIISELNLPSQILEKPAVKITSKLFIILEKKLAEIIAQDLNFSSIAI